MSYLDEAVFAVIISLSGIICIDTGFGMVDIGYSLVNNGERNHTRYF